MKQFNIIVQRALTARERQEVLAPLSSYFNLVFFLASFFVNRESTSNVQYDDTR